AGIASWITFYNGRRPHQELGNRTPMAMWREGTTGLSMARDIQRSPSNYALDFLPRGLFRSRTPGPPPFSSFSEEAAAEKHMAQLQHNMWVTNARGAALSIITGGGKWVEIKIAADSLYQHLLLTAEKKFWRCVESGEPPRLFGAEPPRARI